MTERPKYHIKTTIVLYLHHLRQYPAFMWPLLAITISNIVLGDFVQPLITAQVLGRLSAGQYDPHHLWASFGAALTWYAVANILSGVIGWRLAVWLVWSLEVRVVRDLAVRAFNHLMGLSTNFHANRFGGTLVSQASKLTSAYIRLMDSTMFNLVPLIVTLVATVIILAPRAPIFVALLVAASVVFIAGVTWLSRPVLAANAAESALENQQTGYLADNIANVMAVKTFAASEFENRRYQIIADDVKRAARRSMLTTLSRENYGAIMTQGISIAALFIAVIGVGVLRTDIATVFLMVSYTASLSKQLWEFQNVLRQYNRAFGDASGMVEILQLEPEIKDPVNPEPLRVQGGAIEFRHVDFTHPGSKAALFSNFNLQVAAGEKIGLVGHSGSGKTTLTRLLLRFSDIDGGQILVDNQNIAHITQDDLHRAISYVPQEPLLFHRSLHENIAYGRPKAIEAEIRQAARQAHAAEFIDALPHGYDTLVGERGVKLSGGQRQRVVIARAMLKAAPILVLDEATSALDSESERLIQTALWELMEGRTALVIAHRLSTVQHLDRIVVLDHGRVVEQGTHTHLLAKGGVYAGLWAHQSGGFLEAD